MRVSGCLSLVEEGGRQPGPVSSTAVRGENDPPRSTARHPTIFQPPKSNPNYTFFRILQPVKRTSKFCACTTPKQTQVLDHTVSPANLLPSRNRKSDSARARVGGPFGRAQDRIVINAIAVCFLRIIFVSPTAAQPKTLTLFLQCSHRHVEADRQDCREKYGHAFHHLHLPFRCNHRTTWWPWSLTVL